MTAPLLAFATPDTKVIIAQRTFSFQKILKILLDFSGLGSGRFDSCVRGVVLWTKSDMMLFMEL